MNNAGTHPTSSQDDVCDSAFLGCTILGAITGAIAAAICAAQLLGGAYTEALGIAGAALGSATFGSLGALVIGPIWAGRRPAEAHDSVAGAFGDVVPG